MRSLLVVLTGILLSINLFAQGRSEINGTILDASGAAIPGATVKVTNTDTSLVRTIESASDGSYAVPDLPVGPYRVEASKQGFATAVQTGIVLQVVSNPTVNLTLKVGNVSEQVSVEANAALVETQATGVGNVMENERIIELPLNGRVATDLITFTGAVIPQGVAGNGGFPGTQQFVIAGGQAFGVAFYLDGSVFNNPWDLANMPFPFPDALQEFKVETSTLTASNGIHAGGTITGVTKAGTNTFHGDAFDYFRNGDMNARNFFSPTRDTLKRNQFGGTIGGPILKNKLFFFFGYQNTRTRQDPVANSANLFVPTAAMIAGDFTACPSDITGLSAAVKSLLIPGTMMFPQSILDPASHNLATLLAPPTTSNPCGNTSVGLITDVNESQYVARGDYQTSQKNSLFGRYIRDHYFRPPAEQFDPGNLLASTQGALDDADQGWAFGDTYLFSSTLVNQFRASVDRIGIHRYDNNYVSACDLGVELVYCGYVPHQSGFTITGGFSVGPGTGGQAVAHTTPIQLNDDVSWVKGNHQINFGVGGEVSKMLFDGNVYSQTNWTFPNMASFLLGQFSANSLSLPNNLNLEKWFVNAYIQDTWKVTSKLTVNAGLRWEPFLPPSNLSGSVYDFSVAALAAGTKTAQFNNSPAGLTFPGDPGFQGKTGENNQWLLMAPRVAVAYDPKGDGKTVIRASFGISYDYNSGELMVNAADAPPYGGTEIFSGLHFYNPYLSDPGGNIFPYNANSANAPFAAGGVYIALQPNLKTTAVNQWNAVVQHQFGRDWLVSATYMGSEASHLWDSYQVNPAVYISGNCSAGQYGLTAPGACSTTANQNYRRQFVLSNYPGALLPSGTPAFGDVDLLDSGGTSSYNGLLLAVTKRLSKGLLMNGNYTWSHCIGDLNIGDSTGNAGAGYVDPTNRRADRGNCQSNEIGGTFSSDRRQIFNLSIVYQTPKFGNTWATRLLSDWKTTAIYHDTSAYWLTASLSTDVALTGATVERPAQLLSNVAATNQGQACPNVAPCISWINPVAYGPPATGTLSGVGKDNIPGPGSWGLDMSLSKEFIIRERHRIEFKAEAFNVTNSFRPGIPAAPGAAGLAAGGSGVNTTFGVSTFGEITSALDPRILQLALRYFF